MIMSMSAFSNALASASAVSLLSLVGIASLPFSEESLKRITFILVSLATGALLGDAIVHILPDETFEREGDDLHMDVPVDIFTAVAGGEIRIPSLERPLILGNVGDSRAYIIQDGSCAQLTVDHSYINELIRNGTLTLETAQTANLKGMESVITRAIGVAPDLKPDFYSVDLKPGAAVLLTSDGLTSYLLADEIAAIVMGTPFETVCASLIEIAKQRGGVDNITCLLLLALAG